MKKAEPMSSGRNRKLNNFKTALGLMSNWVDLDKGIVYHIQEYAEALRNPAIPADKKPDKIRMTNYKTGEDLGYVSIYLIEEKMKDPEPDPRY